MQNRISENKMKIVFYSSNSNIFDPETFKIDVLPSNQEQFREFSKKYPEHQFIFVTQLPLMFMPETSVILDQKLSYKEFAQKILELKPDIAVALSFWVSPYDWLSVNDALIKNELEKNRIKTYCNPLSASLISFDKYKTSQFLKIHKFNTPDSVFIDHDLYFCAGSHKEVLHNVYQDSILSQIKNLKLPLVIKDTVGMSSYGVTVVHTYPEAMGYLNSKRNNSNRIIEEYIQGEHFGLEVYKSKNDFLVLDPYRFTLNQYGITSPKQSTKTGPVTDKKYKISALKKEIKRLCSLLDIQTFCQIDLIFSGGKWFIIEINPRLSGMSFMYAKSFSRSIYDLIFDLCIQGNKKPYSKTPRAFIKDIKLDVMEKEKLTKLKNIPCVELLNQSNDLAARQEREKGFCECIIKGSEGEIKGAEEEILRMIES